ncbi:MAG: hypothetical protein WBG50_17195 [Desulfomonilaceae bacterium]
MKRVLLASLIAAFVATMAYGTTIFSSPAGASVRLCSNGASTAICGQHSLVLSKHLQAERWLDGVTGYFPQVFQESSTYIAAGDDEKKGGDEEKKEEEPSGPDRIWDVVQYG